MQRRGEAGIGSWIPVKWVAVNMGGGNRDDANSLMDGITSEPHANTESSEFGIGHLPWRPLVNLTR
jgi:hypothetical protein